MVNQDLTPVEILQRDVRLQSFRGSRGLPNGQAEVGLCGLTLGDFGGDARDNQKKADEWNQINAEIQSCWFSCSR